MRTIKKFVENLLDRAVLGLEAYMKMKKGKELSNGEIKSMREKIEDRILIIRILQRIKGRMKNGL